MVTISLNSMRSAAERSWDWCVFGASRKWEHLDRDPEKVSREPIRAAVRSQVGEESEQLQGSLPPLRTPRVGKAGRRLGTALVQMGRWVQQSL